MSPKQSTMRQTLIDSYFSLVKTCIHDYIPQPREMNERTTYACSKCGAESGCP